MEKVTVCIPSYNRAKTIKSTIFSILNQTYKNIEIIVCDNASTDNTKEIVNSIQDSRVKYIYFDKHLDVNYSFLRTLKQAETEYICLFHSDDWYYPNIIENQLTFLKEKNVGAVFALMNRCDTMEDINKVNDSNLDKGQDVYDYEKYLSLALSIPGPGLNCPTFMTKRSVLKDVGLFDEPKGMISDMSFWLTIVKKYNIVRVNQYYMNYYESNDQLSKRIFGGGHNVISPSYIILDNEIYNLDKKQLGKIRWCVLKYRFNRLKELKRVNKTRCRNGLQKYDFKYYILDNNPFKIDNVADNEEHYLKLLYKK